MFESGRGSSCSMFHSPTSQHGNKYISIRIQGSKRRYLTFGIMLRGSHFLPAMRSLSSARRCLSTTTTTTPGKGQYVHPLSQLVLEYLQAEQSTWIEKHGLHQGLQVNEDGTFLIKFPSYDKDKARIWYVRLFSKFFRSL